MQWFIISSFLIAFLYALTMIFFLKGWHNVQPSGKRELVPGIKLTVLIALRNEESNIPGLIHALTKQDFPLEDLEILLVDDHSSDNTLGVLRSSTSKLPHFQIISLPERQSGKKAALRFGQTHSTGEILLLTDGDCRPGPAWFTTMLSACTEKDIGMVIGPVILAPAPTGFQKIQQLDYMSMVVSGAGSVGMGRPILAFGPNLAIQNELYTTLVEKIKDNMPSGDDMFIMEAVKKIPEIRIKFAKNEEAIVSSPPSSNFQDFWNQRKRWVSKSGSYRDKDIIGVSLLVYLMNLSIFISLLSSVFSFLPWWVFTILLASKTVCEYPLIHEGAKFFHLPGISWRFLLTQLFHFSYIVLVLPAGMIFSYKWKNILEI